MRFSTVAAPLALAGLAASAPTSPAKRSLFARNNDQTYTDATILQYALTLEHLERAFYRDTLNMYNAGAFKDAGLPDYVRYRFTEVASEEATHVEFLSTALSAAGATPVQECKYAFGIDSVETFIATSALLEAVGVSAYLGAAPAISSKAYLAVAGSILVVEAEHNTWVRATVEHEDPFPRPFFAPLDFNQVYSIAAPLITSCPAGDADSTRLGFNTLPALTVSTKGPYKTGQTVSFSTEASGANYAAFIDAVATKFVPISGNSGSIEIPEGIKGQSYLILTSSNTTTTDANTVAGPALLFLPSQATTFDY